MHGEHKEQIGVFKPRPTMRSTLANEPPKDKEVEPLLEELVEKIVI
jgi:hypothetical protein